MRSPATRLTLAALACIIAGGAAYYLFFIEQPIAARRERMSTFDSTARSVISALGAARAAQLSYVAEGQSSTVWESTVEGSLSVAPVEIDTLRTLSATEEARAALVEAAERVAEFAELDRRALDYLEADERLMAGDVVLAEGAPAAAAAIELVDAAWQSEAGALAALEADHRRQQMSVAGGGAAALLLIVVLLAALSPAASRAAARSPAADRPAGLDLHLREAPALPESQASAAPLPAAERPVAAVPDVPAPVSPPPAADVEPVATPPQTSVLRTAADICVSIGAVSDGGQLHELLGRAAALMEASGLIVWVGDADGGDLKAATAHGYPAHVLARMPAIPRAADNAAAAAYRTASLQVVVSPQEQSSGTPGTIVAPMVTAAGCVGALTAEVAPGRETAEATQALALLFAAQLSALLAGDSAASSDAQAASA